MINKAVRSMSLNLSPWQCWLANNSLKFRRNTAKFV
jgi:hypothetical protein